MPQYTHEYIISVITGWVWLWGSPLFLDLLAQQEVWHTNTSKFWRGDNDPTWGRMGIPNHKCRKHQEIIGGWRPQHLGACAEMQTQNVFQCFADVESLVLGYQEERRIFGGVGLNISGDMSVHLPPGNYCVSFIKHAHQRVPQLNTQYTWITSTQDSIYNQACMSEHGPTHWQLTTKSFVPDKRELKPTRAQNHCNLFHPKRRLAQPAWVHWPHPGLSHMLFDTRQKSPPNMLNVACT